MGVEGLRVFQLAYSTSLDVHRASLSWPKVEQYGGIADQLRRSSKAVCALLAEGEGRLGASRKEFARYLTMALGSCDEARLWCRYAEDLGYAPAGSSRSVACGLLGGRPDAERPDRSISPGDVVS